MSSPARPTDLPRLLGLVTEYAIDYTDRAERSPVAVAAGTDELRAVLGGPLPAHGQDAAATLRALIAGGERGVLPSTAARFFGFVMGGAHPVAVATDWLTAVWDQTATMHATSPTASVAEEVVAGWLVDLFGLPTSTSVGFTSGCSTANLVGLAAARHHVFAAHGWDVEQRGLIGAPVPRVLVGGGCHASVTRALRLLGLGGQIRSVETDDEGRMRLEALAAALDETHDETHDDGPLIVCGQVGNTDTGTIDHLPAVCAMTHARGGWVHLDAAFGMWAAASPGTRHHVAGLDRADSWSTDAHKWLNVPYDSGLALCAHPAAHRAALRTHADYFTVAAPEHRDPMDTTVEMSKRARALVLWTTLRHLGRDGVADLVDRTCTLAGRLARRLDACAGLTVLNEVLLNQVLVRLDPVGDRTRAEVTAAVVAALQAGGAAWASPTIWDGEPALRLSVCNWQTTEADVDACADVLHAARERLRPVPQPV